MGGFLAAGMGARRLFIFYSAHSFVFYLKPYIYFTVNYDGVVIM